MSEDIDHDIFQALTKAKQAFDKCIEKYGWDVNLEWLFSVRELDCEGRTVRLITLGNEEKVKE